MTPQEIRQGQDGEENPELIADPGPGQNPKKTPSHWIWILGYPSQTQDWWFGPPFDQANEIRHHLNTGHLPTT